jgi:hypothetical protein
MISKCIYKNQCPFIGRLINIENLLLHRILKFFSTIWALPWGSIGCFTYPRVTTFRTITTDSTPITFSHLFLSPIIGSICVYIILMGRFINKLKKHPCQRMNIPIGEYIGNKKTSDYLLNPLQIFSKRAIWIIITTNKLSIFTLSFHKIMSTSWTYSLIKDYIYQSKWKKISNIWPTSPGNSKSKWQFYLDKLYFYVINKQIDFGGFQ